MIINTNKANKDSNTDYPDNADNLRYIIYLVN